VIEADETVEELEFGGDLRLAVLAKLEVAGLDDSHSVDSLR
jgi:hypothetical protein